MSPVNVMLLELYIAFLKSDKLPPPTSAEIIVSSMPVSIGMSVSFKSTALTDDITNIKQKTVIKNKNIFFIVSLPKM